MKKYKYVAICIGVINLIGILLTCLTLTDKGYFFDGQFMAGIIMVIGTYIVMVIFVAILIGKYGK